MLDLLCPLVLKQLKLSLVGTGLGRSLQHSRQLWEIWQAVRTSPERGGILCQDLCTQLLIPGLCDPTKVFVDVGAHIGSVIAAVRYRHPGIRVVAFEADPTKASTLANKFPGVEVHNCALGEEEGDVTFFIDTKRPGYSSLSRGARAPEEVREISVVMRRLDDTIGETIEVEMIKIDVEGAELGVLRGSPKLLQRCRPAVLFESGPEAAKAMGFTIDGLFDWFARREYEVLVPNRVAHDGPSLTRDGFSEAHHYPSRTLDYFAIPAERRVDFRERARNALGVIVES